MGAATIVSPRDCRSPEFVSITTGVRRVERRRRLVEQQRLWIPSSARAIVTRCFSPPDSVARPVEESGLEPHLHEGVHEPRFRQSTEGVGG